METKEIIMINKHAKTKNLKTINFTMIDLKEHNLDE